MFALAFSLGILSYIIFFLGIFGLLYKPILILCTLLFGVWLIWLVKEKHPRFLSFPFKPLEKALFFLILLQIGINAVGALGPELGFDALWYHGTLPEIYLVHHQILHLPGTLFYYSDMPKLIEMLYTAVLSFGVDILPKLLHFAFGLACCIALYSLSRKFLSKTLALAVVVVFYSNLVVGWESISGYIDLGRTFFEILALTAFIEWDRTSEFFWLTIAAVMTGLAITSKLLAFGTLGIFLVLILIRAVKDKTSFSQVTKQLLGFSAIAISIPLPWLIFSFIHTGNPVYPFFSSVYPVSPAGGIQPTFFVDVWNLFTASSDPLSPIYLAFLPLVIRYWRKFITPLHFVGVYAFLALVVWILTPRTGGGRFILPYLPALSLLSVYPMQFEEKNLQKVLFGIIIMVSIISLMYRGVANAKFVPVLLGKETKTQFLTMHLNFSFGDFYDTDGFFASHVGKKDLVLLEGFHNLFYVTFPYTLDANDRKVTYLAVQKSNIVPKQFSRWHFIYENPITHVYVYKK